MEGNFNDSVYAAQNANGEYSLFMNNCSQKTISILAESETDYQSILSYPAKKVIYIAPTVTDAVIKSAASTRNKGLKQQVTVQRVITKKGHGGGGGRYAPRREYR